MTSPIVERALAWRLPADAPPIPTPPPGSTRHFVDGWNCATGGPNLAGGAPCDQSDHQYTRWCAGFEAGQQAMSAAPIAHRDAWDRLRNVRYRFITTGT